MIINEFSDSILNTVRRIIKETVNEEDIVVDMTIGNGHDTLYLAKIVSKGMVFGFDIQMEAINNTKELLDTNNITNYKLFNTTHEDIDIILSHYKHNIKLILFNLGYLPGSNKLIMTRAKSTLNAVIKSLNMISGDGLILIVVYPHEEGKKEGILLKEYLNNHNLKYREYHNTLKEYAPYLLVI